MEKILEVKDLNIFLNTYNGKIHAVRNVDFYLNKKETLVVVGESGCGKTIMAKSIIGLLPENISEISENSQILFNGRDILKMNYKEIESIRGRDISMIFQDPMTFLNPTMTIGEQIAESFIIHDKISKRKALNKALDILEMVKIPNAKTRLKQYPNEFSGGMRQRVIIAIALACKPKILIADEPTTALDVTIQADIMELLCDIKNQSNVSLILITHDLGVAAEMADRIQVVYAGKIIERGSKEEIFKNPKHPYTIALLNSVPNFTNNRDERLYSLKGTPPDLFNPPNYCAFAPRCKYCMKICTMLNPEVTNISSTHSVSCWLQHSLAAKTNVVREIRRS